MRKKIAIALMVLVAAIAVFLGVAAMQPSEFHIGRSSAMAATPAEVFAQVNDFHNWQKWSPWASLDPNATATFEGPDSGVGAIFRWAGNNEVGEGSMTIIESNPPELIRIRLDFVKPFEDTSTAEFTFKPDGEQTRVTWSMYGQSKFIGKVMCMFMDMDEMVGGQFEKGLASIKAIVEAPPAAAPSPTE